MTLKSLKISAGVVFAGFHCADRVRFLRIALAIVITELTP